MFITLLYKIIFGTIVQSNLLSFQIHRFPLFDTINKRLSIISRIPLRTLMIETVQLQRCNSNDFSVVLTLHSMIFDHCSFHEDNSFCIYCLRKMTIPKVANTMHELRVLLSRKSSVGHAHSSVFYLFH